MSKKSSFFTCIGIIAAYWALIFFGPFLVMLYNKVAVWFSGGGFYEGSFGYKILVFFSQPIGCAFAHSAAQSISKDKHNICVLVNETISACLFTLLVFSAFFLLNDPLSAVNHITSLALNVFFAVSTGKALGNSLQTSLGQVSSVTQPTSQSTLKPVKEICTIDEYEEKALEWGVSIDIAQRLINYERAEKGLPPVEFEKYDR